MLTDPKTFFLSVLTEGGPWLTFDHFLTSDERRKIGTETIFVASTTFHIYSLLEALVYGSGGRSFDHRSEGTGLKSRQASFLSQASFAPSFTVSFL